MKYNLEVFSRQYPLVVFFVQHLAYNRGLRAARDAITDHREFWASTTDGHLKLASIAWCKVFGSHKEDLHWTKAPTDHTVQQASQDFRHRVLSQTGFTQEQWEIYHTKMLAMRDKYVAHLDLYDPISEPVPSFDPALQVAYTYQEWARELIKPALLNQPTLSSQYEQWVAETALIVQQQRHL
jgi:hypothetical protein